MAFLADGGELVYLFSRKQLYCKSYNFYPRYLCRIVKFDTAEEAQRSIELFNGRAQVDGPALEVRYDRARK